MMISRYDDERLLIVQHTEHSRVSGYLAAHWGNEVFARPQPYLPLVIAVQEHDNGWWHWELAPKLNQEGHPPDYIGASRTLGQDWFQIYTEGVARVAQRDPYAGLMTVMHGLGIVNGGYGLLKYRPDASSEPDMKDFVHGREALRQELLAQVRASDRYREDATDERLWTNYRWMQVVEQMGQFVCNRYPLNSAERRNGPGPDLGQVPAPVAPGREDVQVTLEVLDATRALVRPYPFDVNPLPIPFRGRLVSARPYTDPDQFLSDYYTAEHVNITYTLLAA
jgi:hypothetical protein